MGILDWFKRSNLNNPAVPLSANNIQSYYSGSTGTVSVNQFTAFMHPSIYQATSMLSGDIAKMSLQPFRKTGDKSREVDQGHPAWRACCRQWHPLLQSYYGWRRLILHSLIWSRGFAWITRDNTGQIELYNLLPDRTVWDENAQMWQTEISDEYGNGREIVYLFPSEVLAVEGLQWSNHNETPLIRMARESWAAGLAQIGFQSKFFQQGMFAGGFLEIPATFTKQAADNLEEGFRQRHNNPDNWFKVMVLKDGAKFHSAQVNAADGQMSEAVEQSARDVARWFNIPPSKLGIADSTSYGELAEANQSYYDQALSPWMEAITSECWMKLLTEDEKQQDSHEFAFDIRKLFHANPRVMAEVGAAQFQNGFITTNEFRAMAHMNPVEGGDMRILPLNYLMVDEDGEWINPNVADTEPDTLDEETPENTEQDDDSVDTEPDTEADTEADQRAISRDLERFYVVTHVRNQCNRWRPDRLVRWWDDNRESLLEWCPTQRDLIQAIEDTFQLESDDCLYRIREILNNANSRKQTDGEADQEQPDVSDN